MLKNKYYYCCQNELFVLYDNQHFISCSEDDIQYKILSGITNDGELHSWKYKIKVGIIKLIKDRSPLKAIPESATIQFVINLFFPTIFTSRNHVKYFLTVIGDILNAKTTDIYIASVCLKNIINELHLQNNAYFENINLINNIIRSNKTTLIQSLFRNCPFKICLYRSCFSTKFMSIQTKTSLKS